MSYELQVSIQQVSPETAIINLIGDITSFAKRPIQDAYDKVTRSGVRNIILNFVENNIICSPGIVALLNVVVEARKRNQYLSMAVPNPYFQKIFSMMDLNRNITIFDSLEAATQHAGVM